MSTLAIEIPESLKVKLAETARERGESEAQVITEALQAYLASPERTSSTESFAALAADLIGCASGGPPDLSSNRSHLDGYGQS